MTQWENSDIGYCIKHYADDFQRGLKRSGCVSKEMNGESFRKNGPLMTNQRHNGNKSDSCERNKKEVRLVLRIGFRGLWAAAVVLALLGGQGCDPAKRHRTLSFFFDGVPPLEEPEEMREGGLQEKQDGKEGLTASVKMNQTKDSGTPSSGEETDDSSKMALVQHLPYEMKMCDGCHEIEKGSSGIPSGFSLHEEKTKLCSMCHDSMSQEELRKTYTWVHGPVQYGACLECHHPHQSPNPYMVKGRTIQELCLRCHDEKRLLSAGIHSDIGETDCTECHDPHGSRERYMLRF